MNLCSKHTALPKLEINWSEFMRSPANIISGMILLAGLVVFALRFTLGLGGVAAMNDNNPWGIWLSFNILCGAALAAGGYTCSATVHLFGMKKYRSALRPAISTAFLGYLCIIIVLVADLGRPWLLPLPIFWTQGTSSLLFAATLCLILYLLLLFVEWSPAPLEWLDRKRLSPMRRLVLRLTIPLTVLGVILATIHQSSLGALYLIAPGKVHPLWYSSFIPVFFFFSSIYAGLSMVIFEGCLTRKSKLAGKTGQRYNEESSGVVLGFGKAAAFIMFGYLCMRIIDLGMQDKWSYLFTDYGAWFTMELALFVALPCFLYALGVREKRIALIRLASVLALLGIILYRFNVSLIGFNWQLPAAERYLPSVTELIFSVFVLTCIISAYRFMASFMPILFEHPKYKDEHQ